MQNTKSQFKLIIYSLSLMAFIDAIGGSLVFPIISALFMDDKNGLILQPPFISRQMLYGLSFALFPLASIISMPLIGSLSDKHGRKKIIFICCGLLTFDYLISMMSVLLHSVWLFLFGRIFTGLLSGVAAGINALIVDFSDNDSDLMSNFKLPMLASIVGFIMGPGLSIFVSGQHALSLSTPFMIGFILSAVNLLILAALFLTFKHSASKYKEPIITEKKVVSVFATIINDMLFIFSDKNKRVLAYAYIAFEIGLGLFFQSLPLYLAVSLHYEPHQISIFFIGMAIFLTLGMYVLQPLFNRFISPNIQLKLCVIIALSLLFVGAILVKWNFIFSTYYILSFFILCGTICAITQLVSLDFARFFTKFGHESNQGRIMGGFGQLSAIGMVISSVMVGEMTYRAEWLIFLISGLVLIFTYKLLKNCLLTDVMS